MKTIQIASNEELIKKINSYPNHYVFRGHAKADWELRPTLERIVGDGDFGKPAGRSEERSLGQFRSKFPVCRQNEPEPRTDLSWLALMQHCGVPTRLLDFSESPYVALYFALEDYDMSSDDNFAVIALDYKAVIERSLELIPEINHDFKADFISVCQMRDDVLKLLVGPNTPPVLWVTEPRQVNSRLDRQAGTFLFSNILKTRISDLLESRYHDCDICKLSIPGDLYRNVYALLRKANINGKALYGDLY